MKKKIMKQYKIKPAYYDEWGVYAEGDEIVTLDEIKRLAVEWEATVYELMEQVEEL